MGFKGTIVNRLNGGLGRTNPTDDGVCLLVVGAGIVATGLALNTAVEFLTVENAEAVGITPSYDDTNSILAHHHIDEFFRISPDGNLFVVLVANAAIKMVGFVRNVTDVVADFPAYIAQKQLINSTLRAQNRNISAMLIEGNEFSSATAISAYPDLRGEEADNISVVIAHDPGIASIKAAYANYGAIGSALGALSVRGVHENIASVDIENKPSIYRANRDYPLTDKARLRWLDGALQNGTQFSSLTAAEIVALSLKGYIFAGSYSGYAGIFFSDSHTATLSSSDYSRIENNRTWDKGADAIRNILLPRVKSNLQKDPETGTIDAGEAGELEELARTALRPMEAAQEISGFEVFIDASQTLLNDTPLQVKADLVKNNIIHEITVDLGLTNKIS
jgi:hypothetical protein